MRTYKGRYILSDASKSNRTRKSKKIVITSDTPKPCYTDEGILMMNVYDFLLNPELIDL